MTPLTPRQAKVLAYIREYTVAKGFQPTLREMMHHFRIHSPNGILCHLQALEKKGRIIQGKGRARAIVVLDRDGKCPYCGGKVG